MSAGVRPRWPVPPNWAWATLSQLGEIVGGGTPSTKEPAYWGDEITWISPADLTGYSNKTIGKGRKGLSKLGLNNSSAKVMPAGSVHFSSRAPVGHVVISSKPTATNQGFKSLVPASGLVNSYIYYYLIASREYARSRANGTTFLELSGKAFGELAIPVAPTGEQHRIVSMIDRLFSELDAGIESLQKARAQLATYRQSVLKNAFDGRLTAQWGEMSRDRLEAPTQLLDRIKRARTERYECQLTEWRMAVDEWTESPRSDKRPTRPAPPKAVPPLLRTETERLPTLPAGWSYLRLGLLIDEPKYGTSKKCGHNFSGTGVLRIPNVVDGVINTEDLKGARFDSADVQAFSLMQGDVLMIRSNGSISIVGKSAIVSEEEEEYLYAGYLMRLRTNPDVITPEYLNLVLGSQFIRVQIEEKAKSTSGVNNINAREVQSLVVPLCSVDEQRMIVKQLSQVLAIIDALDGNIKDRMLVTEGLRQAILARAFRGQLVPQDPSIVPASFVLDKISADRARTAKSTTRRPVGKRRAAKSLQYD
ncbi:MAG: restriction endonuclease subunit S [Spirochaetaceae bacterium]|nr:restriction endonuclease subunit S [Spirochaetaceae bacterium]